MVILFLQLPEPQLLSLLDMWTVEKQVEKEHFPAYVFVI